MPIYEYPLRGVRAPVRDAGPRRRGAVLSDLRQPDAGARVLDLRGEHRRRQRDAVGGAGPVRHVRRSARRGFVLDELASAARVRTPLARPAACEAQRDDPPSPGVEGRRRAPAAPRIAGRTPRAGPRPRARARPQRKRDRLIFRKRLPSPDDVADALRRLSRIAALRGDAPAAAALADAARHSATLDPKALKAALDEPARAFDPAIAPHIAAIAAEGPAAAATAAERRLPRDVAGIARAGIDLDGARRGRRLHVAADLAAAWHDRPTGDVAALLAEMRAGQSRLLLGRALGAVDLLVEAMGRAQPSLTLYPAGGAAALRADRRRSAGPRRRRRSRAPPWPRGRTASPPPTSGGAAATPSRSSGTARKSPCAPWPTPALGAALVHYSGSREHVAQLAERARARGLRLTPAGLVDANGRVRPAASEADALRRARSAVDPAGAAARPRRDRARGTRRVPAGRSRSPTSRAICTRTRCGATAATRPRR